MVWGAPKSWLASSTKYFHLTYFQLASEFVKQQKCFLRAKTAKKGISPLQRVICVHQSQHFALFTQPNGWLVYIHAMVIEAQFPICCGMRAIVGDDPMGKVR